MVGGQCEWHRVETDKLCMALGHITFLNGWKKM